jgi:hypothetical protein
MTVSVVRRHSSTALALVIVAFAARANAQTAPDPPEDARPAPSPPERPPPDKRAQARAFFDSGVTHFDRGESSAALADFLRSRELFPTRAATKNASVCLRRENRFDEALDMFEELLRFPDLSPADRAFAESQSAELRGAVGALEIAGAEPGASIVVDGRARGTYPPPAPLRVSAGTHVVRVYEEGFLPFERRVDVAGRQVVALEAKLARLTEGGRLVVTEATSKALDVVVDNVVVGKSPWEGTLAVGPHTVALRGENDEGTPPASAAVRLRDVTHLNLSAETLDATLRIAPVPATAMVSLDGVLVGQGVWEGKLRSGAHKIEIGADGFLTQTRETTIARGERGAVTVALERDPESALFRAAHPPRVFAEIDIAPAIGLAFGGEARGACTGGCSADVPFGFGATVRGGYELSSGLALGIDAGFMALAAGTSGRNASLVPKGLASEQGAIDEAIYLRGFRVGPSAAYRFGDRFPITVRLGAGVFFGSASDGRTSARGAFQTSTGTKYDVSVSESATASYAYLAPEVRIGYRVVGRFEVSIGLTLLAFVALDQPAWTDASPVLAGAPGAASDGLSTFGRQTTAGGFLLTALPSIGVHQAF